MPRRPRVNPAAVPPSSVVQQRGSRDAAAHPSPAEKGGIEDLRVLYDIHGGEIFRFCCRLLGDRMLAEEAVQETFLRAWRSGHRWDPSVAGMRTWMYAIARNVCIDVLRARDVRPRIERGPSADRTDVGLDDPEFDGMLSRWMLEEALRRIRPDQREAIVLTHLNDRPYAESAEQLGIPDATLRTRVFYGLKALRLALEEMGWHD
jgi:RNA polymerase sigma-70 factor, ECF subfamily